MNPSLSRPQIAAVTVALLGMIAYMLSQPHGVAGTPAGLAHDLPWLARLLDRYPVLINLATCWLLWCDPQIPRARLVAPLALCHFAGALLVLQLPLNLVLGSLLALLTAVALVARPRPNRVIIGRCIVLAGLAIAIDAVAH